MEGRQIFADWQSYARDVVPPGAGEIQVEECRRAFYAGAWSAFCAVLEATEPADDAECERRLDALQKEIENAPKDLSL